jgi:carbon-monoxide dehydrogenase medium subunit
MIPAVFNYQKVKTVNEALAALSNDDTKLLAGGYSLIPAMKLRLTRPATVIDIGGIEELKGIEETDGEIVIHAGCTHNDILRNDIIRKYLPFFSEAAGTIGDTQVRNRGTIGGSLAHADPAADWPAPVLAADALIVIRSNRGTRNLKGNDFFTGFFSTTLQPDEIITEIRIPIPAKGTRSAYVNFEQPASRFAIIGCAVMRFPSGQVNIAVTGAAEVPFREHSAEQFLSGKELTPENIDQAASLAFDGVEFLSDHYASAEYRKHLAKIYLKKALHAVL